MKIIDLTPDYHKWLSFPMLERSEFIWLILEVDPGTLRSLSDKERYRLNENYYLDQKLSEYTYYNKYELMDMPHSAPPKLWVERCLKDDWSLPEGLTKSAIKLGIWQDNSESSSGLNKAMSSRERDNLLRLIGAMLTLVTSSDHSGKARSKYKTEDDLINDLLSVYTGVDGISNGTITKKFAEAKRLLNLR
jgi:hypothetical protein